MARYYFVGTLLPEMRLEEPPALSFATLKRILDDNLEQHDRHLVHAICLYYDLENMRRLWKGEPISPYGNYDEADLREAILSPNLLPNYVACFLEEQPSEADRLKSFPQLIASYFRQGSQSEQRFVRKYLSFERKMRLIQAALRAKKMDRDLTQELYFEDPEEEFVEHLLEQCHAGHFELPKEFEPLEALFEEHYDSPTNLYKAVASYRICHIERLAAANPFSISRILASMLQLIIVEEWQKIEAAKGSSRIDQYIKEYA